MGLPKPYRLKHWRQFQTVYGQGARYSGRYLTLRCLRPAAPNAIAPTQIGIAVGKKVSKKAVVRNRLKRRVRAIVQPLLPELQTGYQLIFSVKSRALECEYEHFLRELKQLLTKAEVWHGH